MSEVHPLIQAMRIFRENANEHLESESVFIESLFCCLFAATSRGWQSKKPDVSGELGKEVMRLQFPALDDDNLLQMWKITLATERKQDPAAVVNTMGVFLRRQEAERRRATEEAARQAQEVEKKAEEREAWKKILDEGIHVLGLPARVLPKFQDNGIKYVGDLLRWGHEGLRSARFKKSSIDKIGKALTAYNRHLWLEDTSRFEWWSPPTE